MFAFLFAAAKLLRIVLITLRSVAGILVVSHGINRWVQSRRT